MDNREDEKLGKPLDTNRIGVALIGAGMIAKTHVAALSALQHQLMLKTVVSRRPENARYLANSYDGPPRLFG